MMLSHLGDAESIISNVFMVRQVFVSEIAIWTFNQIG